MPIQAEETQNLSKNGPGREAEANPEAGGGRMGLANSATAGAPSDGTPEAATTAITWPVPGGPLEKVRPTSELKIAANRGNARRSTGPRTEGGKRRVSLNALKPRSTRLLGLAEARTLRQEPGAAEKLYRQLIAPYEPVPALLAAHFEDFARLRLELEAWERIRDARLESQWQQSDIDRRRAFYEMERDLPGKAEDVLENGVFALPDSPAKFKKAAECLELLRFHLVDGHFDVEPILRVLYGKNLQPASDRAQTISIRCQKLAAKARSALNKEQFQELIQFVDQEQQDALTAYGLHLDEKTITRSGRLARLGSSREDRWMNQQGERLRQAIDRKQWVITGLLQTLYRKNREEGSDSSNPAKGHPPSPPKISKETKPTGALESTNRPSKRAKTKPKQSQTKPNSSPTPPG